MVLQHLSFPGVMPHLLAIQSDIQNCAATLEKYHLFWDIRSSGNSSRDAALLVQSELEYLLLLLRSLYDALQCTASAIARLFTSLNGSKVDELPTSFRRMVMKDRALLSAADIAARWKIPHALAEWYEDEALKFAQCPLARY